MKAIKLVGCKNLHYFPRKKTYAENNTYVVGDTEAFTMLALEEERTGMPMFLETAMPEGLEGVEDEGEEGEEEQSQVVASKPKAKAKGKNTPKVITNKIDPRKDGSISMS